MSFDPQFYTMFSEQLKVTPVTGRDKYNNPVTGTPWTVPCRVAGKGIALRRKDGDDETPIFDLWALTNGRDISHDDQLEIIGTNPQWKQGRMILFAIGNYTDDHGTHHTKLQCGWMYHRQGQ